MRDRAPLVVLPYRTVLLDIILASSRYCQATTSVLHYDTLASQSPAEPAGLRSSLALQATFLASVEADQCSTLHLMVRFRPSLLSRHCPASLVVRRILDLSTAPVFSARVAADEICISRARSGPSASLRARPCSTLATSPAPYSKPRRSNRLRGWISLEITQTELAGRDTDAFRSSFCKDTITGTISLKAQLGHGEVLLGASSRHVCERGVGRRASLG